MTQAQYTVFYEDGGHQHNEVDQGVFSGVGLCEIITLGAQRWSYCIPVAWAAEWPGGKRGAQVLLAESIAAGRVIELVEGKYVARMVPGDVEPASPTPTLDKLANTAEPKRDPLPHFNQRTEFDNFKGWDRAISGRDIADPSYCTPRPTHALQRVSDSADPMHGSAWLKG